MRLLVAGGGTGGHLFPGVAIAEALRARDPAAEVRFVGTARGIEARVLPELGWELSLIRISGLKTVGVWGAVRGALRLPGALWQSRRLLRAFRPDVVIGVGGYASGPVVLMARLMGLPTAICEQNSIPGLTNKILGRVVHRVFLTFAESRRFFAPRKTILSGNPVRQSLLTAFAQPPPPEVSETSDRPPEVSETSDRETSVRTVSEVSLSKVSERPIPEISETSVSSEVSPSEVSETSVKASSEVSETPVKASPEVSPSEVSETSGRAGVVGVARVFVCGGSQGATAVNDLACEALSALARERPVRVVHQSGAADRERIEARYRAAGVDAEVRAFISEMVEQYLQADVIVARAGATTLAELALAGRPAILVPYPFAADNHQELNAREMAEAGAALRFRQADLTADILARSLGELLRDPDRRAAMGSAMKALARPGAAATVVDWCVAEATARKKR
jgi:undecaprenyldiphospho-muramoylpentapeptide beta-N-acetylglucosaminyltransferase